MQIAHEFADLHDRAGRMKAKGVIRDVVSWEQSRAYFYWRLRRRLAEDEARREYKAATDGSMSRDDVTDALRRAMASQLGASADFENDQAVAQWLEGDRQNLQQRVAAAKRAELVSRLSRELSEMDPIGRREVIASMPPA